MIKKRKILNFIANLGLIFIFILFSLNGIIELFPNIFFNHFQYLIAIVLSIIFSYILVKSNNYVCNLILIILSTIVLLFLIIASIYFFIKPLSSNGYNNLTTGILSIVFLECLLFILPFYILKLVLFIKK